MNIIIVESVNDIAFYKRLYKDLKKSQTNVEIEAIRTSTEFMDLEKGLSEKSLKIKITDVLADIPKKGIKKVGIAIDLDNETPESRINLLNKSFGVIFQEYDSVFSPITEVNQLQSQKIGDNEFKVAYYFTNLNNVGDLDDLLLHLISCSKKPSFDCLKKNKDCFSNINEKEFKKLCLYMYIRYDACSKKDRGQASKKCSLEYSLLEKNDFNFESPELEQTKEFIRLFL